MAWPPADEPRLLTDSGIDWIVGHVVAIPLASLYSPRAFRIRRSIGPIAFDRVQNAAPFALTGGDEMVRDFVRYPSHALCTTLGLEQLSDECATALADSPHLARIRRLVVHAPKVTLAPLLASPHASRLESITVVDALTPTLRALATLPKAVHSLRIHNAARAIAAGDLRMDAVATLLSTLTSRLARLELHGLGAPLEALAGNSCFESLFELVLVGCQLRGAELLGTLRELRLVDARESAFDDTALAAIAECSRLVELALRSTPITDDGALALAAAELPALASLDITDTKVTDRGATALASARTLPALAHLAMARGAKYRPVVPVGSGPDSASTRVASLDDATTWLPPRPTPETTSKDPAYLAVYPADMAHRDARANGLWPRPPLPCDRQFRHRTVYVCEYCRGTGLRAGEPCPPALHRPTHEPEPHRGPLPPLGSDVATIARTALRFEAAETLVRRLAGTLGGFGVVTSLRTIEWQIFDEAWATHRPSSYPPRPYDRIVSRLGPVPLATTPRWPYVALRAADGDWLVELFTLCVAIYDLGYWLGDWRDDICEIYMPRTLQT